MTVYKNGRKYNPENYRSICLTCICCKFIHMIISHIKHHPKRTTYSIPYNMASERVVPVKHSCLNSDDITYNLEMG